MASARDNVTICWQINENSIRLKFNEWDSHHDKKDRCTMTMLLYCDFYNESGIILF
jgi:hypothetical protein